MNSIPNSDEISESTRQRVLRTLLAHERSTVNELAVSVGINPISIRHHISKLEADGLVDSIEEKHGVGRPRRLYFLSEKGREQFPTRYLRLIIRLLEQLRESLPDAMVNRLFSQIAREMASDYETILNSLNIEERLNLVTKLLGEEGFAVEWEKHGNEYQIREISCPYYHLGQYYPEICSVDQTLISTMLSVPVEKIKCVLRGDAHCTYAVSNLEEYEMKV
jgi:predicted ArsR family transcriptional regulator